MKTLSKVLLQTLAFSLVVALIHYALTQFTALELSRDFLFKSHLFIGILTLLSLSAVVYVWLHFFDRVGFAFLGLVFLKIAAAMVFLYPIIKGPSETVLNPVLHFFAAYFLYLIWDAVQVSLLLRKQPD